METTKHLELNLVLSPHAKSDATIKSLGLSTAFSINKLAETNRHPAHSVCALVAKASWINKNLSVIKKSYVQYPYAALVIVLDEQLEDSDIGFVCLPVPMNKKKVIAKEYRVLVHAFLQQWNKKVALDKVKNEVDLDSFSKPLLNHLLGMFKAKNSFLLISEEDPSPKGFLSLGHDLYFRAAKPCDFESTLQMLDQCQKGKSKFSLYCLDGVGLRGYKVWIGLEYEVVKEVSEEDFAFAVAPLREHLSNVITLHESQTNNMIDDLTNLYNQRYLITVIEREISRSKRQKSAFSVLFLDVDYFKLVNDTKGHWVGSRILSEMGAVLKGLVRNSDYCFRYGGDEFVVVLVGTDQDQAGLTAERIRRQIEQTEFQVEGIKLSITVSIGVAVFPNHAQNAKELVKLADQAMYVSKRTRNAIHVTGT